MKCTLTWLLVIGALLAILWLVLAPKQQPPEPVMEESSQSEDLGRNIVYEGEGQGDVKPHDVGQYADAGI